MDIVQPASGKVPWQQQQVAPAQPFIERAMTATRERWQLEGARTCERQKRNAARGKYVQWNECSLLLAVSERVAGNMEQFLLRVLAAPAHQVVPTTLR